MENCIYGDPLDASGLPPTTGEAFAFATSSCAVASTTIATSSDIAILPVYTSGEVMIGLLLLVQILISLTGAVVVALDKVKITRKVLGYGGGDVEIKDI